MHLFIHLLSIFLINYYINKNFYSYFISLQKQILNYLNFLMTNFISNTKIIIVLNQYLILLLQLKVLTIYYFLCQKNAYQKNSYFYKILQIKIYDYQY